MVCVGLQLGVGVGGGVIVRECVDVGGGDWEKDSDLVGVGGGVIVAEGVGVGGGVRVREPENVGTVGLPEDDAENDHVSLATTVHECGFEKVFVGLKVKEKVGSSVCVDVRITVGVNDKLFVGITVLVGERVSEGDKSTVGVTEDVCVGSSLRVEDPDDVGERLSESD